MRDPLVRRTSAGLILALPILIYFTSTAASGEAGTTGGSGASMLGLVEVLLFLGAGLAFRFRRQAAGGLRERAFLDYLHSRPAGG